jgi:hypothetical protein
MFRHRTTVVLALVASVALSRLIDAVRTGLAERFSAARSAHETLERSELQHLPWLLSGLLAIAALIEGLLLLRRRRHAAA